MAFVPRAAVVGGRDLIAGERAAHARRLGSIYSSRPVLSPWPRGGAGMRKGTRASTQRSSCASSAITGPDSPEDTRLCSTAQIASLGDGALFEGPAPRETLVAHMLQYTEALEAQYGQLVDEWVQMP